MRITTKDKIIIELLAQNPNGLAMSEISSLMGLDYGNTHRKIGRMVRHGFVRKNHGNPALYYLRARDVPTIMLRVQCPKCKSEGIASDIQISKKCCNPGCLTAEGHRTRYFITKQRIIGAIRLGMRI